MLVPDERDMENRLGVIDEDRYKKQEDRVKQRTEIHTLDKQSSTLPFKFYFKLCKLITKGNL